MMEHFLPQIERIQTKLKELKNFDTQNNLFGAKHHQYQFNPPLTLDEIANIENTLNNPLPNDFKAFLHYLGDGGAGRGYGIFSSLEFVDRFDNHYCQNSLKTLNVLSKFDETISETQWDTQIRPYIFCEDLENLDTLNPTQIDEIHEVRLSEYYAGFLPICTEGCGADWALVLRGKYQGRVIFAHIDYSLPTLQPFTNFLDWYESWFEFAYRSLDAQKLLGKSF